jgi:hypothetical protein
MKNSHFLFPILIAGIVCSITGIAVAAPREGLLVSETGDLITGYSTVIIDGGLAYPVRNLETSRWYTVDIIQESADGTILCTVGEPMDLIPEGVATDEIQSGDEVMDDDATVPEK